MSSFIAYIRSFPPLRTVLGLLFWTMGLLILLSLWQWQLERLVWKKGLIEQHRYEESQAVLPELTPLNLKTSAPDKFFLHKYMMRTDGAEINPEQLIFVGPRPKKDKKGFHVYAPMTLEDSDIAVMTMIGWLPEEQKDELQTLISGKNWPINVTGYFVPDNQGNAVENRPDQGFWYKANIADMAGHYGYEVLKIKELDIFSDASKQTPLTFFYLENELVPSLEPRLYRDIILKNDHAYYATFWLSMSFAWTIIFIMAAFFPLIKETFIRKREDKETQSEDTVA